MRARGRGFAIFLVVMVVVAVCSVVFADAGTATSDPCGRTHVWAQAKSEPQSGSVLLESIAVLPEIPCGRTPTGTGRLGGDARDDLSAQSPAVQPPAPRAPPLA